jgi:EAL domain-containing protein (putative c-di-GMP-specific phosphodiesterase class I)
LGKALGVKCGAAGPEFTQTLHKLRARGCDLAQGCLFGKPSTAFTGSTGGFFEAEKKFRTQINND